MRNRFKILIIGCFFLILLLFPKQSYAADFSFDYDVLYNVFESGKTQVTQNIILTNLTTEAYAQNYTITISSDRISSIAAFDQNGTITPSVTKKSGQTEISLPFNAQVVGINKKLVFTLIYDNFDIANKNGRIWEIIIPGISKNEQLRSYNISLIVPETFGTAAYVSPPSADLYNWTLNEHKGNGINALFGSEQSYWFRLKYHLKNTAKTAQLQEITLPPDTAFQKVYISSISKMPENVVVDTDGNWLATFKLAPKSTEDIIIEGTAQTYIAPISDSSPIELTKAEIEMYTKSQKYWEQSTEISQVAQNLKTPQAIYEYVVSHLTYNYNRITPGIERLGAPYALNNPQDAVCMEYSDLFVALARSAGIPARVNHGYAYTTNSRLQPITLTTDILHAWPQYFDFSKKMWISVDPTWGNTTNGIDYFHKLDFNHITFAILGIASDYPFPAGSYRSETSEKDVFVEFGEAQPQSQISYSNVLLSRFVLSGIKNTQILRLKNLGTQLSKPQQIFFENKDIVVSSTAFSAIPPHGYTDIPVVFHLPLTFFPEKLNSPVSIDGITYPIEFVSVPVMYALLPLLVAIGILVCFRLRRNRYAKK